jgi:hypothetical protein
MSKFDQYIESIVQQPSLHDALNRNLPIITNLVNVANRLANDPRADIRMYIRTLYQSAKILNDAFDNIYNSFGKELVNNRELKDFRSKLDQLMQFLSKNMQVDIRGAEQYLQKNIPISIYSMRDTFNTIIKNIKQNVQQQS